MSDAVLRVEKLENGFEVEVCDAKIAKANKKPKTSYQSPWKGYAFTTAKEVIAFVTSHINSLPQSSGDQFNSAADEAFKKE